MGRCVWMRGGTTARLRCAARPELRERWVVWVSKGVPRRAYASGSYLLEIVRSCVRWARTKKAVAYASGS